MKILIAVSVLISAALVPSVAVADETPVNGTSLTTLMDGFYGPGGYTRLDDSADQIWNGIWTSGEWKFINWSMIPSGGVLLVGMNNAPTWFQVNGTPNIKFYSDPALNPDGLDHMVTFQLGNDPSAFLWAWDLSGQGGVAFDGNFDDILFEIHGVLPVRPVPEPGTMVLLGAGVMGLVAARRRRNASKA